MQDLLIIRHGESEWNVEKRWQGWLDAPLTARGLQQAQDRADTLLASGFTPKIVICSDLGRALHTAEIVAGALGVPWRANPGLRERSGGEWEGLILPEIEARWPGLRDAWRRGELAAPPGGEENDTVLARFDEAVTDIAAADMPALVITHHGLLRLVAVRAGVGVHALIPNLGGYWFTVENGELLSPKPLDDLAIATETPAVE